MVPGGLILTHTHLAAACLGAHAVAHELWTLLCALGSNAGRLGDGPVAKGATATGRPANAAGLALAAFLGGAGSPVLGHLHNLLVSGNNIGSDYPALCKLCVSSCTSLAF